MRKIFKLLSFLLCLEVIFSSFYPVIVWADWYQDMMAGYTQPADTPQESTYSPYEPPPSSAVPTEIPISVPEPPSTAPSYSHFEPTPTLTLPASNPVQSEPTPVPYHNPIDDWTNNFVPTLTPIPTPTTSSWSEIGTSQPTSTPVPYQRSTPTPTLQPFKAPKGESCLEGVILNSCAKRECDPNLGKIVCYEEIQRSDCSSYFKVGSPQVETCSSPPLPSVMVIPSCQIGSVIQYHIQPQCDPNIGKKVWLNKVYDADCSPTLVPAEIEGTKCFSPSPTPTPTQTFSTPVPSVSPAVANPVISNPCVNPMTGTPEQENCIAAYNGQADRQNTDNQNDLAGQRGVPVYDPVIDPLSATSNLATSAGHGISSLIPQASPPSATQENPQTAKQVADATLKAKREFRQALASYGCDSSTPDEPCQESPEDKAKKLAPVLNLPPDSPPQAVFAKIQDIGDTAGIKVEGDLGSFTVSAYQTKSNATLENTSQTNNPPAYCYATAILPACWNKNITDTFTIDKLKETVNQEAQVFQRIGEGFWKRDPTGAVSIAKKVADLETTTMPELQKAHDETGLPVYNGDGYGNKTGFVWNHEGAIINLMEQARKDVIEGKAANLDEAYEKYSQLHGFSVSKDDLKDYSQRVVNMTPEQQAKLQAYVEAHQKATGEVQDIYWDVAVNTAMMAAGGLGETARAGHAAEVGIREAVPGVELGETALKDSLAEAVQGSHWYSRVGDFVGEKIIQPAKERLQAVDKTAGEISKLPEGLVVQPEESTHFLGLPIEPEPPVEYSPQAAEWAKTLFGDSGKTPSQYEMGMIDSWTYSGVPQEVAKTKVDQARRFLDYLFDDQNLVTLSNGAKIPKPPGLDAPLNVQRAWEALRWDNRIPDLIQLGWADKSHIVFGIGGRDADVLAADALIRQHNLSDNPAVGEMIQTANDSLSKIEQYQQRWWGTAQGISYRRLDPDSVIVGHQDNMADFVGKYSSSTGQIIVRNDILQSVPENRARVVVHEVIHAIQDAAGSVRSFRAELGSSLGIDNINKLIEGTTEYATHFFSNNTGTEALMQANQPLRQSFQSHPQALHYVVYKDQVVAVHDDLITAIINNGKSFDEAREIVLKAGLDGKYKELVDAAGGPKAVKKILDKVPSINANVAVTPSKLVAAGDKALAENAVKAGLNRKGTGKSISQNQPSEFPWNLITKVFAQENISQNNATLDANNYEALVKKELIKNAILQDGKVDSDFINEVMKTRVVNQKVDQITGGYVFSTDTSGTAEGNIAQGKYLVGTQSLPGVDIRVPNMADNRQGNIVIPVAVKAGTGKVEKISQVLNQNENSAATSSAKVTVVVFADQNNNGQLDASEKILPWAGVKVTLKKLDQEKKINLLAGWNLITLTALPVQVLNASTLISEIGKQGGEVTAISSLVDGAWKTYVIRGDKEYSLDDFGIEPGKAYFVKALKPSSFEFLGQDFASPFKLKLNSGWNAVGLPKTSSPYTISQFFAKLEKDQLKGESGARWRSGLWDSFVLRNQQKYGEDFPIESNRGYVIKLDQGGEVLP